MTDEAEGTWASTSSSDEEPTTGYTIESVNTGLLGEHVREYVEHDGEQYGPGDELQLTDTQFKSLKDAGVKFES